MQPIVIDIDCETSWCNVESVKCEHVLLLSV